MILRNDYAGSSSGFFNRPWIEYQQGFGSPTGLLYQYQQGFGSPTALYWIGLDRLHQLTQGNCQVRFDLQDRGGTWHYAQYSSFSVGDSSTSYKLTIGGYSGDAGFDAMAGNDGRQFSTYDADHDGRGGNCASFYGGGFWWGGGGGGGGGCGYTRITTSTKSILFEWLTSNGWMDLNAVEVYLLC